MPTDPLEYHGNTGLIVKHFGELNTDKYGLDSATCVWTCPMFAFNLAPGLGSAHPIWSWLYMERRRVSIDPGFAIITGEYVGITGNRTPSQYEASYSESEEPIQTHPDFVTTIGGKPSAVLNGAIFIDQDTQKVTPDDSRGVFREFKSLIDGALNPFAGISSFLSPQVTLREIWMSTSPVSTGGLGHISGPPMSIALPDGGNWLYTGASFQQRGRVYANSREWRSSGRRGWNSDIY